MRAMLPSWFPAAMSRRMTMLRGLARNSKARRGHLVVVSAEVFQVPATRAGVRVADLDRPVAQ